MGKLTRILSIDGGGIRGIIPAMMLAEIEKRTNAHIADLFDFVAGTSTGGILALAVTKPDDKGKPALSASQLVELYETEGHNIFPKPSWFRLLGNLVCEDKYDCQGLEGVLTRYFGDAELKDAICELLVTSYNIELHVPYLFKRTKARQDPGRHNFLMKEVARSTSAAPTYFEPEKLQIKASQTDYYPLIDGGVYANNPAMCAYVEAVRLNPGSEFLVASLGTGKLTKPIRYEDARKMGVAQWARPLLDIVFDGVSDTVDYELQQLLDTSDTAQRYYRLQPVLSEDLKAMDDAGQWKVRQLRLLAENYISTNSDAIDSLCKTLTSVAAAGA